MGDAEPLDAAVRPWGPALEDLGFPLADGTVIHRTTEDPRVLWLNGVGVAQFARAGRNARLREALALFERLSCADRRAWERALRDVWRSALTTWSAALMDDAASPQNEPMALGVVFSVSPSANTLAQLQTVPSICEPSYSTKFQALITEMGGTVSLGCSEYELPVRLALDCRRAEPAETTALLAAVLMLVQSMNDKQRRWWRVREVAIECPALEARALATLLDLSRLGVRVPVLPVIRDVADPCSSLGITQFIRSMVLEDPGSATATSTLVVCQPALAPSLLSCAQQSQCMTTIQLQLWATRAWQLTDDDVMEHQALWRYVAYSLFSRDATHKTTRLCTDLKHLRLSHVEAIRMIVDAPHPLSQLFGLPTPPARFVIASRFHLRDPLRDATTDQTLPVVFQSDHPLTVRVIERTSANWWRVWLPGGGQTWVHRDESAVCDQANDAPAEIALISELVIESMDEQSMDAVIEFLRLIGPSLRHLRLGGYYGFQSLSAWCRQLFCVCPHLTDLRFGSANFDSLGVFLDFAETGTCQLRRLEITAQMRAPDAVLRLLSTLADPSNRLSRSLQHLKLGEIVVAETEIPNTLAAVQLLLERNRCLHTVDLHFVHDVTTTSRGGAIDLSSLLGAAQKPVLVPCAALPMRQRLAVISVAEVTCSRRLDANVLTRIFAFAGECRARHVELRYHESTWAGMVA